MIQEYQQRLGTHTNLWDDDPTMPMNMLVTMTTIALLAIKNTTIRITTSIAVHASLVSATLVLDGYRWQD